MDTISFPKKQFLPTHEIRTLHLIRSHWCQDHMDEFTLINHTVCASVFLCRWSYGVVLWEILTYGEVPYRGQPEANDCDHLAYYLRCGNRLAPPPNTSDELLVHSLVTSVINAQARRSHRVVFARNNFIALHFLVIASLCVCSLCDVWRDQSQLVTT